MLLVCPHCATSYVIEAGALGAGRPVRCARCETRWFAGAAGEAPVAEMAEAVAETEFAVSAERPAEAAHEEPAWPPEAETATLLEPDLEPAGLADPGPPLVPDAFIHSDAPPAQIGEPPADVESAAARQTQIAHPRPARRRARGQGGLALLIVGLIGVVTALIAWRAHIVRAVPQSAGFYAAIGLAVNLRGLAFEAVKTSDETQDGVPVLVVAGEIVNVARRTVQVPRLRFALRNAAGVEVYAWTALPEQQVLGVSQRTAFRSRLASPPAGAGEVVVRFFHRTDLAPGH